MIYSVPSRVVSREARHENLWSINYEKCNVLGKKKEDVHWMNKSHKIWEEPTTDMRDPLAEVSSPGYPTT